MEYLEYWALDPPELEECDWYACKDVCGGGCDRSRFALLWDLFEYLLLGLECTGTPYTAGSPFSLALDMLCEVSTDINGGGIGLILSFNEYLKYIKINVKHKFNYRKPKRKLTAIFRIWFLVNKCVT